MTGDRPPDSAAPAPDIEQAARRRLMHRIAADSTPHHLTHHAGPDGWQALSDGVEFKLLNEAQDGTLSYLLRLQPGAELPPHRHPVDEECVVLDGEVNIGDLHVGAGSYHLGRRGVFHDTVRTDGGAVLFLRGAPPDPSLLL